MCVKRKFFTVDFIVIFHSAVREVIYVVSNDCIGSFFQLQTRLLKSHAKRILREANIKEALFAISQHPLFLNHSPNWTNFFHEFSLKQRVNLCLNLHFEI